MPAAVQPSLHGRRSLLVDLLGHGYSDKPLDFGYRVEDHARTVVALIESIGARECGVIGHSMGGGVGILVAAGLPDVISLLIMAEGNTGPDAVGHFGDVTEKQFLDAGFAELLAGQAEQAAAQPEGLRAAHLGMTRALEPRATYREAVSMDHETDPPLGPTLRNLQIPRWYLYGEWSDPDEEFEREMAAMGVGWKIVPRAGHPMGLQNPEGLAEAVAEIIRTSWRK